LDLKRLASYPHHLKWNKFCDLFANLNGVSNQDTAIQAQPPWRLNFFIALHVNSFLIGIDLKIYNKGA